MRGIYQTIKKRNPYTLPIIIFCVLFSSLLAVPAFGQEAKGLRKEPSLKIGQTVPKDFWIREHLFFLNGDTVRKTFEEYKGHLLIFDFWATWCKSCIEGFPKIDFLKTKFNTEVNFILVNCLQTKDTKDKITNFLDKHSKDYKVGQPILILDDYLQALFPHRGVPHFVWINTDGVFFAATHPHEINYTSIKEVLNGNAKAVHQKIDENLFNVSAFDTDTTNVIRQVTIKDYIEGAKVNTGSFSRIGNYYSYQLTNQYLNYWCYLAYQEELRGIPLQHFIYSPYLDINTKQLLLNSEQYDMFCFELLSINKLEQKDIQQELKALLQNNFNLVLQRSKNDKDVYKVHVNDKIKSHYSDGGLEVRQMNSEIGPLYYKNMSLFSFILGMRRFLSRPMVIDAVPKTKVDIYFPKPLEMMTEKEILDFLNQLGIELIPKREYIEFVEFKPFKYD